MNERLRDRGGRETSKEMSIAGHYDETITLPRAVRFPVELIPPVGFEADSLETWPRVDGRLEFVDGRLLFMLPCGDVQQDTVMDVAAVLMPWVRGHAGFVVGGNEAGMCLSGATRAADAAAWRRADLDGYTGGLRRVPPVLAVEVAGVDDPEAQLREKAAWYLRAGVAVIWLVLPESREVVVVTAGGEVRCGLEQSLPAHAELPELAPNVADFFLQIMQR